MIECSKGRLILVEKAASYDVCIIGGGINGAGIAAYASQNKFKVFLCEQNDFAGATSSNSTKLIHGGLRYLEQYNFSLVRAALKERAVLQDMAPHLIWPIEFIFVNNDKIRNRWFARLGLFIYDRLAIGFKNKSYNKTQKVVLDNNSYYQTGYLYTDLWVDDARLVIANLQHAEEYGASIKKQTQLVSANYLSAHQIWNIELLDLKQNKSFKIQSRYLVNASGPWVNHVLANISINHNLFQIKHDIRLVKGSHIIVDKLYESQQSYVLQNQDGRIVFVIPYEDNFTLIGTTEIDYAEQDLSTKPAITEIEKQYLIDSYNNYFKTKISQDQIRFSYSGVRPLLYDPKTSVSDNTRDYKIDVDDHQALINIYGGKITTYRLLAQKVLSLISDDKKIKAKDFKLPGSNILDPAIQGTGYYKTNHSYFSNNLKLKYPWLSDNLAARYTKTYGSLISRVLTNARSILDMGHNFGYELYQKEIDYLIDYEYATSLEDIVWRRTKLGLYLSKQQLLELENYLAKKN